jgi:hypothetical protein
MRSGSLDFSLIGKSLNYKLNWFIGLSLFVLNILGGTWRWKKIMEISVKEKISFFRYLKITWVGLLFNSVLPGAVSGDFIKLIYAKRLDRSLSKTFLIISVFMDRILGLMGLLAILGVSSIIFYEELATLSPKVAALLHLNFFIFFGMLLFLGLMFLPQKAQRPILLFSNSLPFIGKYVHKIFSQVWLVGGHKKVVFFGVAISTATQLSNIAAFWILTKAFYDAPLSLGHSFAFIPIGLVSIAIPITPAGLGVGHYIFDTLFRYFGVSQGASLFNFYFLGTIITNCFGLIPYLTMGQKFSEDELKELETASD